jgi:hypothetical protein
MGDNRQPQDDPLEEAVKAARQMTVPDRPTDASVLTRLGTIPGETTPVVPVPASPKWRFLMRLAVPSAAALLLLGGAALVVLTNTPSPTLADVVKAAQKYKLVKYKQVQTTDTKDFVGTTESTVYADLKALRFRIESLNRFQDPDDRTKRIEEVNVSVQDVPKGRHLMTNTHPGGKVRPPRKDAWLGRAGGGAKNSKSFLENLQEFQQKKGVTQLKDKVGGVETIRYRLEEDKQTVSIWVDAQTKLPVRMEQEFTDPTPDITRNRFVWTDFEWDPGLPKGFRNLDALFDTTPPEGYALTDETKNDKKPGGPAAVPPK